MPNPNAWHPLTTRLEALSRPCACSMQPGQHPNGRALDRYADPDLAASLKRLASPEAASRLAVAAAEWAARRRALPELVRARFPAASIPECSAALSAAPGQMLSRSPCWRRVLSKRARRFCS